MSTTPTFTEVASVASVASASTLSGCVQAALTYLHRAEASEARSVGTVVRNLVAVGDIVAAAIAGKLVTSPSHFAKVAAGFTTAKAWTAHKEAIQATNDGAQVSIPRQRTFDRAYKLSQALAPQIAKGATLDDDESTSLVRSYLVTHEMPTVGGFTEWAMNGCDDKPTPAPRASVKVTFAPAKLAAKLAAKLTPAQLRQLARQLVKLADEATTVTGVVNAA